MVFFPSDILAILVNNWCDSHGVFGRQISVLTSRSNTSDKAFDSFSMKSHLPTCFFSFFRVSRNISHEALHNSWYKTTSSLGWVFSFWLVRCWNRVSRAGMLGRRCRRTVRGIGEYTSSQLLSMLCKWGHYSSRPSFTSLSATLNSLLTSIDAISRLFK